MKYLALLATALLLPACFDDEPVDGVGLTLQNQQGALIRVQVAVDRQSHPDDHIDVMQSPLSTQDYSFDGVHRLSVRVYRQDGLLLFDDFWSADDLRRADRKVTVTIAP